MANKISYFSQDELAEREEGRERKSNVEMARHEKYMYMEGRVKIVPNFIELCMLRILNTILVYEIKFIYT